MNQLQIRHYNSISEIPFEHWMQFEGNGGFCSYEWQRAVEDFAKQPPNAHYTLAYLGNRPAGAMILSMVDNVDQEGGVARLILGGNRRLRKIFGKRFVPNLAAGTPFGYGGQLLIASDIDTARQQGVAHELLVAAEALSKSRKTPLWFPGVLAGDEILLRTLNKAGYLSARYLPLAEIAIEWTTFDEYVASVKQTHRNVAKDIRRERNRCRTAGIKFEEPDSLTGLDATFIRLSNKTYARHGDLGSPFTTGFYDALKEQLGEKYLVCNAIKDGEILGFITMLSDGHTAWADSYGVDYADADSAFVYFNLAYQWPIRKAIELGLRRIVLGRGQYDLKIRRGCTITDSYILHKPSNLISKVLYPTLFRCIDHHYAKQISLSLCLRDDSRSASVGLQV